MTLARSFVALAHASARGFAHSRVGSATASVSLATMNETPFSPVNLLCRGGHSASPSAARVRGEAWVVRLMTIVACCAALIACGGRTETGACERRGCEVESILTGQPGSIGDDSTVGSPGDTTRVTPAPVITAPVAP